jgi:hypothetical protein
MLDPDQDPDPNESIRIHNPDFIYTKLQLINTTCLTKKKSVGVMKLSARMLSGGSALNGSFMFTLKTKKIGKFRKS